MRGCTHLGDRRPRWNEIGSRARDALRGCDATDARRRSIASRGRRGPSSAYGHLPTVGAGIASGALALCRAHGLAVLFRFVVLLPILAQAVAPVRQYLAERRAFL